MTHSVEAQPNIPDLLARKSQADAAFEQSKDHILKLKKISPKTALAVGAHHVLLEMHAIASSTVVVRASGRESDAALLQGEVKLRFDIISAARKGYFDPLKRHLVSMADKEDAAQTNDSRFLSSQYRKISQKIPPAGNSYNFSVK